MKSKFKLSIFSLMIIFSFFLLSCSKNSVHTNSLNSSNFLVHYIDVGQGDATLIQINDKNLLIDSGPRTSEKDIISFLKSKKIKDIHYLIATHPHEDHIGNMDEIIDLFNVHSFYAPKVTTTTKTFENMVQALKRKNLKINILKEGTSSINLGPNTETLVFYPPNELQEKNLNNFSPIIKIQYKDSTFLFTGDAEHEANNYVLKGNYPISAQVLKLGHHGSKTSCEQDFLSRVNPSIAIASCGEDNSYGHPHKEVLDLLKKNKITLFRTDTDGTITLSSDGTKVSKLK